MTTRAEDYDVAVIGGGLAGLAAARALAEQGLRVAVYEALGEFGGKSGAQLLDGRFEDHGYHIVPSWYVNTRRLMDETGASAHFRQEDIYYQLVEGEYPHYRFFARPKGWKGVLDGFLRPPMGLAHSILLFYAMFDAVAARGRSDAEQDASVRSFLGSKFYVSPQVLTELDTMVATPGTVGIDEMSIRALERVAAAALRTRRIEVYAPVANLRAALVEPILTSLRSRGVVLYPATRVTRVAGDDAGAFVIDAPGGGCTARRVVIALPCEVVADVVAAELLQKTPSLQALGKLQSRPLGALHVYLRGRLQGIPTGHIRLVGSAHALALLDIGRCWHELGDVGPSILNVVVGRCGDLQDLSDEEATRMLLAELESYIPELGDVGVERTVFQRHADEPLFVPTAGSWEHRPEAKTETPGLFLAGDYCRTWVVISGMEAAVAAGLQAAAAILAETGLPSATVEIRAAPLLPPALARAATVLLLPLATLARVVVGLRDRRARRVAIGTDT